MDRKRVHGKGQIGHRGGLGGFACEGHDWSGRLIHIEMSACQRQSAATSLRAGWVHDAFKAAKAVKQSSFLIARYSTACLCNRSTACKLSWQAQQGDWNQGRSFSSNH